MKTVKPTMAAIATREEVKQAMKDWIPTDSPYRGGIIKVSDTNFFLALKYVQFVKDGGDAAYDYWVARLQRDVPHGTSQSGGTITPVIVEKTKLSLETETGGEHIVAGWFVRDGIHRLAAAEKVGITHVPALMIDTPCDDLVRSFRTAPPEE